jgi:hypothetical protein
MKKSLQFLFAVLLFGQVSVAQGINFGIKGGANYSTFSVNGVSSSNLTSFHAGAIMEIKTPIIGIQPEILYSSQGTKISGGDDLKLDYISIPIVLKYYITKLSFEVGPQFSYLVSDNLPSGSGLEIKNSDIGVLGGVGLNIFGGLFAQARYVVGVSKNTNFDGGRNNVFQLSVGYKF